MKIDRVILGDCLEKMKDIPEKSIDMILTDLPYGMTANHWDSIIPLDRLWAEFKRLVKEDSVVVLTASQPFTSKLVISNEDMFKHEWIWIKNQGSNFANTVREPMKEHESVLMFANQKWKYNKQMQERTGGGLTRSKYDLNWKTKSTNYREFEGRLGNKISELRVPSSWQKFNVEKGLHPNQKPVSLFEYLIKTYTNEGDLVLDCCAGSGTTAIACINTNRKYICIEKDQKYYDIINQRVGETKCHMVKKFGLT